MGGGNPIKKVTKAVSKAVSDPVQLGSYALGGLTGGMLSSSSKLVDEAGRAVDNVTDSDWWTKAATSGLSAISDPGTLAGYGLGGASIGILASGDKANETYGALSDAERDKVLGEIEYAQALYDEQQAQLAQDKLDSDKAKAAADEAQERATRMAKGRRGLLYQGKNETGVEKSNVLGG